MTHDDNTSEVFDCVNTQSVAHRRALESARITLRCSATISSPLVERESCDAHFFAAGLGEELAKRKVDGRREFWQAWLIEKVPAVLAPMAKVKALV